MPLKRKKSFGKAKPKVKVEDAPLEGLDKVIQSSANAMNTLTLIEGHLHEGAQPAPEDLAILMNSLIDNLSALHDSGDELYTEIPLAMLDALDEESKRASATPQTYQHQKLGAIEAEAKAMDDRVRFLFDLNKSLTDMEA